MTTVPAYDFQEWRTVPLADRTIPSQDFTFLEDRTLVVAQDHERFLRLAHYTQAGVPISADDVTGLGHGDMLETNAVGWLVTKNRRGRYVQLTLGDTKLRPAAWPVAGKAGKRPHWFQGECGWQDLRFRTKGCPYVAEGPKYPHQPVVKPTLEIWQGGVKHEQSLWDLGRDARGRPLGGKLEPEGVAVYTSINGNPWLVVGIVVGYHSAYELRLYRARLAPPKVAA